MKIAVLSTVNNTVLPTVNNIVLPTVNNIVLSTVPTVNITVLSTVPTVNITVAVTVNNIVLPTVNNIVLSTVNNIVLSLSTVNIIVLPAFEKANSGSEEHWTLCPGLRSRLINVHQQAAKPVQNIKENCLRKNNWNLSILIVCKNDYRLIYHSTGDIAMENLGWNSLLQRRDIQVFRLVNKVLKKLNYVHQFLINYFNREIMSRTTTKVICCTFLGLELNRPNRTFFILWMWTVFKRLSCK